MNPIIAIDVGGGTQDILIYQPGTEMENNTKLILPSPTQIIARRIEKHTHNGSDIFLYGNLMGGGACSGAVKKHLQAGYRVYATPSAALTFKDNLERVSAMGIKIVDTNPGEYPAIELKDIDLPALQKALEPFEIKLPNEAAIAVQDHGFSPHESNRRFRFTHWEKFLASGGKLSSLIYDENTLPDYFTRMKAVLNNCQEMADKVWLMDTGSAAIMGALEDPQVKEASEKGGIMLVNAGNQHTIAFLIADNRVYGVFEHHTGMLSTEKLSKFLSRFAKSELTNTEVFEDHGHGCEVLPEAQNFSFDFIAITGPRRSLAAPIGFLASPHGDMMLSGSFGLITSVFNKLEKG